MGRKNFGKLIFLQHGRGGNFRADDAWMLCPIWSVSGEATGHGNSDAPMRSARVRCITWRQRRWREVVAAAERAGLLDRRPRIATARHSQLES